MTCCGRLWRNLGRHLRFAHGEEVVIDPLAVQEADMCPNCVTPWKCNGPHEPPLTCFCGAPAVGWVYQVMGDGQTINGLAVCAAHQEEQS